MIDSPNREVAERTRMEKVYSSEATGKTEVIGWIWAYNFDVVHAHRHKHNVEW